LKGVDQFPFFAGCHSALLMAGLSLPEPIE
jgi:hypothetical protein